jgi:aminopeptidase N
MLMLLGIASLAADNLDDITDYSKLTVSEIHKIMGMAKARKLGQMREAAALVPEIKSVRDQTEYNVNFYRIELEIDIPSQIIYGDVLMESKSTINGLDSIEIDLYPSMIIDSVYFSGGTLNYYHLSGKVFIELDQLYDETEIFSVSIKYHGHPTGSGLGGFTFDEHNGSPVVASLSEPWAARSWWPCKDRPDDKADSLDIFITCDTAYFCASNGIMIDTVRNGDGTWTFNYEVRYPITTYLFSVAISNYTIWNDWYYYGDNDSMIIINHVYPDEYENSLSALGIVPYAIGVYADRFGEYPFINEKYGHANFEWPGAMEHQTVTSTSCGFGFTEPVVVHELSHQWWGDMITCNNWHEIWLNEGFASYCEALYYEAKDGVEAYHNYMADMYYTTGGAVYIYDTTNVYNIFSPIVYDKGAWVVHMLRHVVGDSLFFDCLQTYYSSVHQYGDATTDDLKNVCESVAGTDLDYFFDQWIYGQYQPSYYWSYMSEPDPSDGKQWTYFQLKQAQVTNPQVFTMPIDLVFTYNSYIDTVVLFNDVRENVYILKTDSLPVDISLDPDEWILKFSQKTVWTYQLIPFPLDTANQFASYLDSVVAKGGSSSNIYKIISGALPVGLELDSMTGHISGPPQESGEFDFEIYARDRFGSYTDTADYSLFVIWTDSLPGDANDDDHVDIFDVTYLISFLYMEGPPPPVPDQADPDASCTINIFDVTYLISFLYMEGPPPQLGCVSQ